MKNEEVNAICVAAFALRAGCAKVGGDEVAQNCILPYRGLAIRWASAVPVVLKLSGVCRI